MKKIANKINLKKTVIFTIFISQLAIANLVASAEDNDTLDTEYPLKLEQIEPDEINASDVDLIETVEDFNPTSSSSCYVVAEGKFADQFGANGIEGAEWRLCDDGFEFPQKLISESA